MCADKHEMSAKLPYTIVVALRHRDVIKNMTTDALQLGTVLFMVPADGTIAAKIITVLTRYRPIVLELIKNCNACNFTRRRFLELI